MSHYGEIDCLGCKGAVEGGGSDGFKVNPLARSLAHLFFCCGVRENM